MLDVEVEQDAQAACSGSAHFKKIFSAFNERASSAQPISPPKHGHRPPDARWLRKSCKAQVSYVFSPLRVQGQGTSTRGSFKEPD